VAIIVMTGEGPKAEVVLITQIGVRHDFPNLVIHHHLVARMFRPVSTEDPLIWYESKQSVECISPDLDNW
jgi:hypothetical protein